MRRCSVAAVAGPRSPPLTTQSPRLNAIMRAVLNCVSRSPPENDESTETSPGGGGGGRQSQKKKVNPVGL